MPDMDEQTRRAMRALAVAAAFDRHFPPEGVGAPRSIVDYDDDEIDVIFAELARLDRADAARRDDAWVRATAAEED